MKEKELREKVHCFMCNEKVTTKNLGIFWTIKAQQHMIDINAIRRQSGLEMMLGSSELAQVMGPNEDMTKEITEELDIVICQDCATKNKLLLKIISLTN